MKRKYQQFDPRRIIVMAAITGILVLSISGCGNDGPPNVTGSTPVVTDGSSDVTGGTPDVSNGQPDVIEGSSDIPDGTPSVIEESSDFLLDGPPELPDRPFPGDHDGLFVSEHGTMRFNGDGRSITINFDKKLAKMTGLPKGEHSGTYQFVSGEMAPSGRMVMRYDYAQAIDIQIDKNGDGRIDADAVIDVGQVTEDGSYQTGTGCTTADRITFQFFDDEWEYMDFLKTEEGN